MKDMDSSSNFLKSRQTKRTTEESEDIVRLSNEDSGIVGKMERRSSLCASENVNNDYIA